MFLFAAWMSACAADSDHGADEPAGEPMLPRDGRSDGHDDDTNVTPQRIDFMQEDAATATEMDASADAEIVRTDGGVPSDAGARDADLSDGAVSPSARSQDDRAFSVDSVTLAFGRVRGATVETDRWFGVLGNAGYRIEVPKNWNGMLVMYAHGYHGTGTALTVKSPPIRRHLIEQGYAWAASSFSTNYYDVRAGLEDTNALALAFQRIAAQNGRVLAEPVKRYIMGHSLGGHVAAAAIERETVERARHLVHYHGAVPMCGAVGGTALNDYLAGFETVAHALASQPITDWPVPTHDAARDALVSSLFERFPSDPTGPGDVLKQVTMQLSGGVRPLFEEGFSGPSQELLWRALGSEGLLDGIVRGEVADTRALVFQIDADPALSQAEQALNAQVFRVTPDASANGPREDGVRWVPPVDAVLTVPVVTLHTLGDLFVPFAMQRAYLEKARATGSARWLVQRAIRGASHCDFTVEEERQAFVAMVDWDQRGVVPAGDPIDDPATVASPTFGCRFTVNTFGSDDDPEVRSARTGLPACPVVQ